MLSGTILIGTLRVELTSSISFCFSSSPFFLVWVRETVKESREYCSYQNVWKEISSRANSVNSDQKLMVQNKASHQVLLFVAHHDPPAFRHN